jgi:flagellar motor component MotA
MAGGIALFKERCRLKLKIVEQTAVDAYVASAIAGLLGVVHTLGVADAPALVLGHLLGGALCVPFFGMILGRAVLTPMADQLGALYEQEAREMEAFRLAVDDAGIEAFPASTFEALA